MSASILTIRTPSGISGDMLVTGLSLMAGIDNAGLDKLVNSIGLDLPTETFIIRRTVVEGISGWRATVKLKQEKAHRTFANVKQIINDSGMTDGAKPIAIRTFQLLAEAEGQVHDKHPDQVHFHEVGAMDSILDICLAAALIEIIAPTEVVCSPLPLCDGVVQSAHGPLATPAPAVQELLNGLPVYGIDSRGETVTPTAIAFLKGLPVRFGLWPTVNIMKIARVYGSRLLPGIPNGAIFALGHRIIDT